MGITDMKINEVVRQTGLSKRTIYYYIEEQLVSPKINTSNGYYIFSEQDITKLKMLQQLRKMNFSIKDIHSILQYPSAAHVYLQKQIEQLEKDHILLKEKIACLIDLEKQLPLMVSYQDLSTALCSMIFPDKSVRSYFSDSASDAKLVCLYLWGTFLHGIPMTEYRQYLWGKILSATVSSNNTNIAVLKQFLYSLPADQMDMEFAGRNLHIEEIINLTPYEIPDYAQKMQHRLKELIKSKNHLEYWKSAYKIRILPSVHLFDSEINLLVRELSPRFALYSQNIHTCCNLIYNWLNSKKGAALNEEILFSLNGYIDIDSHHHGELAALFSLPKEI